MKNLFIFRAPYRARFVHACGFSLVEMKRVSRYERQTAMSRVPKHYDGDVGCEPMRRLTAEYRRNTHRSLLTAFSLVEMLMALLVASLLMAALAPVMTKRMKENINVSGTGSAATNKYCAFINDETESLTFEEENGCVVPDGVYSANAIIASGGGGGGGAAGMGENESGEATFLDSSNSNGVSQTFDGTVKSMRVMIAGAGGGGGGGSYYTNNKATPSSQSDCTNFGIDMTDTDGHTGTASSPILVYDSANKLCVTAYNQKTSGSRSDGHSRCITFTNGSFSTPVCTKEGADYACAALKSKYNMEQEIWRLPTGAEEANWGWEFAIKPIAKGGLYMCIQKYSISDSPPICEWYINSAPKQRVYPQLVVSSTTKKRLDDGAPWFCLDEKTFTAYQYTKNTNYPTSWYDHGSCATNDTDNRAMYTSVRCVINNIRILDPHPGGGASSGSFASVSVPKNVLEKALELGNEKGRVYIKPGKGGNGGAGSTNTGLAGGDGEDGGSSIVSIYSGLTGGTLVWSLEIPGGYGGKGATSTTNGEAGIKPESNPKCRYYDLTNNSYNSNTSGHEILCKNIPGIESFTAGKDGSSSTGGASVWEGGTPTTAKGGSGSTCVDKTDTEEIKCEIGNSGGNGRIAIKHTVAYPGAGGGGGAAGNLVHITNFSVNKGDVIKAVVGHGGKGGQGVKDGSGTDGSDGGASYIELPNGTQYGTYGGGGGKGGIKGYPGINKAPVPGLGGKALGLITGTKVPKDYYFLGTDGQNAPSLPDDFSSIKQTAGGQGGTNPKISALNPGDDGNNIPCGGLNTIDKIKVNDETSWDGSVCPSDSNVPLPLSRTIYANSFNSDTIKNFSIGSTGGGGGGWQKNATNSSANGAKGMGGYVYIYFGNWSGE